MTMKSVLTGALLICLTGTSPTLSTPATLQTTEGFLGTTLAVPNLSVMSVGEPTNGGCPEARLAL